MHTEEHSDAVPIIRAFHDEISPSSSESVAGKPFTDEGQTAVFKDPVRTAL